ncbi:MAG: hypothetical protein F4227_09555 [Gammaproteobacteria bacterium]|nr:hypothetical protein [Gammaproteobacteria bacterium]
MTTCPFSASIITPDPIARVSRDCQRLPKKSVFPDLTAVMLTTASLTWSTKGAIVVGPVSAGTPLASKAVATIDSTNNDPI